MNAKQLAATYNLSEDSLNMFLSYMKQELTAKPELREWLKNDSTACIKAGLESWLKASEALANELIEGKTVRAIDLRKQVAHEIWTKHNAKPAEFTGMDSEGFACYKGVQL